MDDLILYMCVWFAIGLIGSVACVVEYIITKENRKK